MARRLDLTDPPSLAAHIVLDASGSMGSLADDAVGGINDFVATLKRETPDAIVSLTLFSYGDRITTVWDNVPVADLTDFTRQQYPTTGGTALYDAIARCADLLQNTQATNKTLVILTDGAENSSRTATKASTLQLIEDKQEHDNWLIQYLGANQDAFAEGGAIGTNFGNTMSFNATGSGLRAAFASASASTARYTQSGGDLRVSAYTEEERTASADEDSQ